MCKNVFSSLSMVEYAYTCMYDIFANVTWTFLRKLNIYPIMLIFNLL